MGRVFGALVALALGWALGGCADSGGDGDAAASCAIRLEFKGRVYEEAGVASRKAGPALGKAATLGCDDTGGADDQDVARPVYELYAVPGYKTRWVVIGKGEGETRLFKAESADLPEGVKQLR